MRDLLYLNEGEGLARTLDVPGRRARGRCRAAEVGHGLGAVFTDYDGDGRPDLYVANDADPNQLYRNVADASELGFRFQEVARREGVADPNAGMGIAAADFNRDGRTDLFVTNSRGQLHAAYRSRSTVRPSFADARPEFATAVGTQLDWLGRRRSPTSTSTATSTSCSRTVLSRSRTRRRMPSASR